MLVSLLTFATFTLTYPNKELSTLSAFTAIGFPEFIAFADSVALFNVIRFPMMKLPRILGDLVQCAVSLKRITNFLCSDELDNDNRKEFLEPPFPENSIVSCAVILF